MGRQIRERSERHHTSHSRTSQTTQIEDVEEIYEDIRHHGMPGAGRDGDSMSHKDYASLGSTYGYHGSYNFQGGHSGGATQSFAPGRATNMLSSRPTHWECVSSLNSQLRHLLMSL